jgi:hypothetical protein
MFPNPRYDPSSRRWRRRHGPAARRSPHLTDIATAAVVAYGAYRLGSWAWRAFLRSDDDDDGDEVASKGEADADGDGDDGGDLLREWANSDDLPPWCRGAAESRAAVARDVLEEERFEPMSPTFAHYIGEVMADGAVDDDDDDDQDDHDDDDDDDGAVDGRTDPDDSTDRCGDGHAAVGRSRRSRVRWGSGGGGRKDSSHRPSPPQDYQHHPRSGEGGGGDDPPRRIIVVADEKSDERGGRGDDNGGGADGGDGAAKKGAKDAAAAIGGAVAAGIAAGMVRACGMKDTTSAYDRERQLRMGRCRLESSRAMTDFLPTLRGAIARETDVSGETAELRRLRARRRAIAETKKRGTDDDDGGVETDHRIAPEEDGNDGDEDAILEKERCLWNSIKNKSVTRLITTAYAHTVIFLTLNVQVNLLGGRLLREEQEEDEEATAGPEQHASSSSSSATAADRYRSSHQTVLSKTYHHLFAEGIPSMVELVGTEVRRVLRDWDALDDDVALQDVSAWLRCARDGIERGRDGDGTSALVRFVVPPQEETGGVGGIDRDDADEPDELAGYILDETYDLLESPAFASAERECLDSTFDRLQTRVLGTMFIEMDRIPLVNAITFLQKGAVSTFHKPPSHRDEMKNWGGILGMMEEPLPSFPNDYISKLARLDAVQELSNVCF